ncbi:MAG: GAF domain-containing protein [Candidatus Lindowbacteria bacterium]|nr:GAF domain-containing protein [Candidatus Lindowbacteria bacterium]
MDVAEENARLKRREKMLVEVTSMLTQQTELSDLLERILTRLRSITDSDAGSLYIVVNHEELRFAVAQNDSKDIPFSSFTIPLSPETVSGYVAMSGETERFDDVYAMDPSLPFKFGAGFDKKFGYRTKSMMVVPMKNAKEEVVGVLQLINKRKAGAVGPINKDTVDEMVCAYTGDDEDFLWILAAQAGMAMERAALYDGIEKLLQGMIESSSASIESRDKTTAGHSQRIAGYMVALAKRINKETEDPFWKNIHYSPVQIRELFYSALLHDIGKIGVREYVLTKANKLPDATMETIKLRIELEIMQDFSKKDEWLEVWEFLEGVNLPVFLTDDKFDRLQEISEMKVRGINGSEKLLLSAYELENLAVRKGNLTASERVEIESHVAHSLDILKKIPWTDDLKRVPMIAGTHHEKLSGKGYPLGLVGDDIPFEGRMLSVCDIFEALTAKDRPYKKAMPVDKALEILGFEVKANALQKEIVDFFIEKKVYNVISDALRKDFTLSSDEILALE